MTDSSIHSLDRVDLERLEIDEAVDLVREGVTELENGDLSLQEAKELRDQCEIILNHLEDRLELGDGETERVTPN